jgi:hypothetical protein
MWTFNSVSLVIIDVSGLWLNNELGRLKNIAEVRAFSNIVNRAKTSSISGKTTDEYGCTVSNYLKIYFSNKYLRILEICWEIPIITSWKMREYSADIFSRTRRDSLESQWVSDHLPIAIGLMTSDCCVPRIWSGQFFDVRYLNQV